MGDTPLADIPGSHLPIDTGPYASRASNAADAIVPVRKADHAGKVLSATIVPAASQVGSATNFADVKLVNLGTGGAGTTVVASRSFSAAGQGVAAGAPAALTVTDDNEVAAGEVLALSYLSQGNGIAIQQHSLSLAYQLT